MEKKTKKSLKQNKKTVLTEDKITNLDEIAKFVKEYCEKHPDLMDELSK